MIKSEGWLLYDKDEQVCRTLCQPPSNDEAGGHVELYVGSSLLIDATKGYVVTKSLCKIHVR